MMPQTDPDAFYSQALRRIGWMIIALGPIGAGALTLLKGFRMGLAFLIGAVFSYISFQGWQRVAMALGPGARKPRSWKFTLRIIVLAALAYGIIKFLGLSIAAAVIGLLVSAAAVILEIIYELIYARA
jgi:hypothetical protein